MIQFIILIQTDIFFKKSDDVEEMYMRNLRISKDIYDIFQVIDVVIKILLLLF